MHMYRSVYFCLVLTIVFLQLPFTEEEACHTYTDIIKAIENAPDGNDMAEWRTELAPAIAVGTDALRSSLQDWAHKAIGN